MSKDTFENRFVSYLPDNYSEVFAVALLAYGEILKEEIGPSGDELKAMNKRLNRRREFMTGQGGLKIPLGDVRDKKTLQAYLNRSAKSPDVIRWLLVDCFFADPFVAIEDEKPIKVPDDQRHKALELLAEWCGLGHRKDEMKRFHDVLKSAVSSHKPWWKRGWVWLLVALFVAVASAGTAFLAAPFIGGAIGATMGLSGAAATSAGLAALGGGSLAVGGAGMAGGVALITGVGAAAGAAGVGAIGGGLALVGALSIDGLRLEMIKLQTTYGYILMRKGAGNENKKAATEVRRSLESLIDDTRKAKDIDDKEERIAVITTGLNWMKNYQAG